MLELYCYIIYINTIRYEYYDVLYYTVYYVIVYYDTMPTLY